MTSAHIWRGGTDGCPKDSNRQPSASPFIKSGRLIFIFTIFRLWRTLRSKVVHLKKEMEDETLVKGLPDHVVLHSLLPRVPWYVRPSLALLSRAWRDAIRNAAEFRDLTRTSQRQEGLILSHRRESSMDPALFLYGLARCISMYVPEDECWWQLPPIKDAAFGLDECGIECVDGKVFVSGGADIKTGVVRADVYMLDIAAGVLQWEKQCSMKSPRWGFLSTFYAGNIFVVGGQSSKDSLVNLAPGPEVYDVQRDSWESVEVEGQHIVYFTCLFSANGKLLARGLCQSRRTETWKVYDTQCNIWKDFGRALAYCSTVCTGEYDLHDAIVRKFDNSRGSWNALDGKLLVEVVGWWTSVAAANSTCVHKFIAVGSTHLYATVCQGDCRFFTLWKGIVDHSFRSVHWQPLVLPNILGCQQMRYLVSCY